MAAAPIAKSSNSSSAILFNDLEFKIPSGDDVDQKASIIPDTVQTLLAKHRCRIFDVPTLLFDKRWLGTDEILIELYASGIDRCKAVSQVFQQKTSALKADFKATANTLRISHIEEVDAKIEAEPLLSLVDFCLWLEPNKMDKIPSDVRFKIENQPYKFDSLLTESLGNIIRGQKYLLKQLKRLAAPSTNTNKGKQANEKGKSAFEKLEKKKNALTDLHKQQVANITEIHSCLTCDQILLVLGKKKGVSVSTPEERQAAESKVVGLSGKLTQAQGSTNRQKRKKLKRKLQKLKTALGSAQQQGTSLEAELSAVDDDPEEEVEETTSSNSNDAKNDHS
jgi:hypothetical protein